jgi:hypothetical protein
MEAAAKVEEAGRPLPFLPPPPYFPRPFHSVTIDKIDLVTAVIKVAANGGIVDKDTHHQ